MNDQVYEHPNNPGTYHVDHLRTDLTSNQERAAFHGVAMNRAYSTPVRIQAALQALEMYEAEVEQLRNEIKALRNDEDFDPNPIITEYDRVVEENARLLAERVKLVNDRFYAGPEEAGS